MAIVELSPLDSRGTDATLWSAPWFELVRSDLRALAELAEQGDWDAVIRWLNNQARGRAVTTVDGLSVTFVSEPTEPRLGYEARIRRTGEVWTRREGAGAWHDCFNALVWLALPQTKAQLNRLQSDAMARRLPTLGRGSLRDAATLFDENAAVVVGDANGARLAALRSRDWSGFFEANRASFATDLQVWVFGHALLDKLRTPFKAICAHAWIVPASGVRGAGVADLDQRLASSLSEATLVPGAFAPLPLLGIPGWWAANEDPVFYKDSGVFRPARSARP